MMLLSTLLQSPQSYLLPYPVNFVVITYQRHRDGYLCRLTYARLLAAGTGCQCVKMADLGACCASDCQWSKCSDAHRAFSTVQKWPINGVFSLFAAFWAIPNTLKRQHGPHNGPRMHGNIRGAFPFESSVDAENTSLQAFSAPTENAGPCMGPALFALVVLACCITYCALIRE